MTTEEIWRMFFLFLLGPMAGAAAAIVIAKSVFFEKPRKWTRNIYWGLGYLMECVICIYGWPALFITLFYEPTFLRWLLNVRWELWGIDFLWPFNKSLSFFILWGQGFLWYSIWFPLVQKYAPKRWFPLGHQKRASSPKRNTVHPEIYDITIIGGGITGTAIAFVLSLFMKGLGKILFLERLKDVALVSSDTASNAQTGHGGDMETNFPFKKALEMRDAEAMLGAFLRKFGDGAFRLVYKMAFGVGEKVKILRERFAMLGSYYPTLRFLEPQEIKDIEPKLMEGRNPNVPVAALYRPNGLSIDYHKVAKCLEREFLNTGKVTAWMNTKTRRIVPKDGYFEIRTNKGIFKTRMIAVAAGANSLYFAQSLGYATDITIIPVGGRFWRFRAVRLNGKVYPVQDPEHPFAKLHTDPDVTNPGEMRAGPTIDFIPLFDREHWRVLIESFKTGLLNFRGQRSILKILGKKKNFLLFLKNLLYRLPLAGKWFVLKEIQNTIPTLRYKDIWYAKGEGGVRPQIVDLKTGELIMGTGKIKGKGIVFDVTPSPGASDSIRNAVINAVFFDKESGKKYEFDAEKFVEVFPETKEAIEHILAAN